MFYLGDFFKKPRKKIGLALGSGGFRGPVHIGALKSLVKNNIPIDYIAGSSIGAMVGAHYAIFRDIEKLTADMLGSKREKLSFLFDLSRSGGLLTGHRVEKFLEKIFDGADFKDAKIPLKIVATDIVSGESTVLEEGEIAEAVRASISIPLTFKPITSKEKILIDGGLSDPVPDDIVKMMGADVVISINLYNLYDYKVNAPSASNVVLRSVELMLYHLAKNTTNCSDIIIEPNTSQFYKVPRLKKYYDPEIIMALIKIGEEETDKHIERIKRIIEN